MRLSILKPRLSSLAAVSFIAAVIMVWSSQPRELSANPTYAPPQGMYPSSVAAVGLVEASSENIALSTPVPGLVTAVYVKVGDQVKSGQRLFSIDDRDLRAKLQVRHEQLHAARAVLQRLTAMPRREDLPPLEAAVREAAAGLADARLQFRLIKEVDDPRAIRREDLQRRRIAVEAAQAKLANAQAALDRVKAGAWKADREVARANVALAESRVREVQTDIDRTTVTAPRAGRILRLNVRVGEFAPSGVLATPLIVFGDVDTLNVRADVDEQDAAAVRADAPAYASPRDHAEIRIPLRFVRIEPLVVPKRQLTGDSAERVDTRVLQVIYQLAHGKSGSDATRLFVGQQVDVYIDRKGATGKAASLPPTGEPRSLTVGYVP